MEKRWSFSRSWHKVCCLVLCHAMTFLFEKALKAIFHGTAFDSVAKNAQVVPGRGGHWWWNLLEGIFCLLRAVFPVLMAFIFLQWTRLISLHIMLIVFWRSLPPCWMMSVCLVHKAILFDWLWREDGRSLWGN